MSSYGAPSYYVIGPDGAKYGPAALPQINQWANEGRVTPDTLVEEVSSGARFRAGNLPGFIVGGPSANPSGGGAVGTVYAPRPDQNPVTPPTGAPRPGAPYGGNPYGQPQPPNYPAEGGGYGYNPQYGSNPYAQNPYGTPPVIKNHLAKSIFSMLCCCTPLGIAAIVFAAQVDGHLRQGDYVRAQQAADRANTLANIAIILGLVGSVIYGIAGAGGMLN